MHPAANALISFVVAGATVAVLWVSQGDRSEPEPVQPSSDAVLDEVRALRSEMQRSLTELGERVTRVEQERASLARAREAAAADVEATPARLAAAAANEPAPAFDFDGAIARLRDPALGDNETERVWASLAKAGRIDDAVAAFEAHAKANPNDAAAHTKLGSAYLQKLMLIPDGPAKGELATLADKSFDRALAVDPQHWEARFSKATSLAFWPPIFGKQKEAIAHFETLVSQQEASGTKADHFAMTYVFLGNLYEQQGNSEKAQEARQKGYRLFPQNAELQRHLTGK